MLAPGHASAHQLNSDANDDSIQCHVLHSCFALTQLQYDLSSRIQHSLTSLHLPQAPQFATDSRVRGTQAKSRDELEAEAMANMPRFKARNVKYVLHACTVVCWKGLI